MSWMYNNAHYLCMWSCKPSLQASYPYSNNTSCAASWNLCALRMLLQ